MKELCEAKENNIKYELNRVGKGQKSSDEKNISREVTEIADLSTTVFFIISDLLLSDSSTILEDTFS